MKYTESSYKATRRDQVWRVGNKSIADTAVARCSC